MQKEFEFDIEAGLNQYTEAYMQWVNQEILSGGMYLLGRYKAEFEAKRLKSVPRSYSQFLYLDTTRSVEDMKWKLLVLILDLHCWHYL